MELKNGYKVIYDKAANGKRAFYASKSGAFTDAEQIGEAIEIGKYKLIYEKNGKIYCSESSVPNFNENGEPVDIAVEGFDKVFVETEDPSGESVLGSGSSNVLVPQDPHVDAISTNGDSHGELTINDNVVTLNVTGTVNWKVNPSGNSDNYFGFKVTAPEGIDPANVVITRPDGKTRVMTNILDGDNFTNMYWKPTGDDRVFTYYIDWNNDGVNDLTVVIDTTKATFIPGEESAE